MTIVECAPDWFSVYHNGRVQGDFGSLAAAARYIRSRGYFVLGVR